MGRWPASKRRREQKGGITINIIKRILGMLAPHKKSLVIGFLMILVLQAGRLYAPKISGIIVDDVIRAGNYDLLPRMLIIYAVLFSCIALLMYLRGLVFENISQSVIFTIRQTLFEHLHELPFRFYDHHRIGEIMSRLTGDVEAIRNFIAGGLITIVEQSFHFIGAMIMIFLIAPQLAGLFLVLTPILAFVGYKFDRTIRPAFNAIRDQGAVLNTKAQENISGIRVVKAYSQEEQEKVEFADENRKHRDCGIRISVIWSNFHPIIEFIASAFPAAVLLVGGMLAQGGSLTPGDVVTIFGYLWMITDPMRQLVNILNMISQCSSSGERIFYYMDIGSEIKECENPQFPQSFQGHVVFDHVNFRYDDEPVLKDICIDVPAGHTLAIMGATGSGKTSIVNLLGRFYECQSGAVTIDGIDVKQYKLKQLRRQLGYVPQETFLFSDSLEGNIAFGNPDLTEEAVRQAAEIAQAKEFIDQLDDGYDTVVGERGMGLSGGQKQRVAIARAIALNPKILILDDSTSAIDMETESAIQAGLKKVLKNRTTFIISHRISSVKNADEIIVLDHGAIAERGVHDELLARKGLYYDIFMDQYRDYQSILGEGKVMEHA